MGSTFLGLEIARSAVVSSQIALHVTGQNMANVKYRRLYEAVG